MEITEIIFVVAWWIAGVSSFVYWWVHEFDLTPPEVLLAAYVGVLGPVAFLVGFLLYRPLGHSKSKVLIKQRKQNEIN